MGLLSFWLVMAGVVAIIASAKGRSAFSWFLYGLVIWPIALVHVLVTHANAQSVEMAAVQRGELKKCPACAELIKREARLCRFCQTPQAA